MQKYLLLDYLSDPVVDISSDAPEPGTQQQLRSRLELARPRQDVFREEAKAEDDKLKAQADQPFPNEHAAKMWCMFHKGDRLLLAESMYNISELSTLTTDQSNTYRSGDMGQRIDSDDQGGQRQDDPVDSADTCQLA